MEYDIFQMAASAFLTDHQSFPKMFHDVFAQTRINFTNDTFNVVFQL